VPASVAGASAPGGPRSTGDRRAQILELAEQGLSATEVAEKVVASHGEVEMVIAVHKRKSR